LIVAFPLIPIILITGAALLFSGTSKTPANKVMPDWLKAQYLSAKQNDATDPRTLGNVADTLRANGFPSEADELIALAKTRAIADSPNTSEADKIVAAAITTVAKIQAEAANVELAQAQKEQAQAQLEFDNAMREAAIAKAEAAKADDEAAAAAAAAGSSYTSTGYGTAAKTSPAAVAKIPTVVETHKNTVAVLTSTQTLAKKLADHLNALIKAQGGVARAKGKEDVSLVKSFQSAVGLKADGKYGPGAARAISGYWGDVPLVFYWPAGTLPKTEVPKYRAALEAVATGADMLTSDYDQMRAKMIRLSAIREQGQGFGAGAPLVPSTSKMTSQEVSDMQAKTAAMFFGA
jgi:peptidoglycan hydrolase-like protein with peptidoglycan-binding domain